VLKRSFNDSLDMAAVGRIPSRRLPHDPIRNDLFNTRLEAAVSES
jgi:hypothetical protein